MTFTAVLVSIFSCLSGFAIGLAAGFMTGAYYGAELWRGAAKDAAKQIGNMISFELCGEHGEDDEDDEDRDTSEDWKRGRK